MFALNSSSSPKVLNNLYGAQTTSEASVRRKWLPIVIVNDASQDIASSDRSISIVFGSRNGELLIDNLVRTMVVVVIDIFFQNTTKMILIDDQNMIETFFTH